jgi:hypothetical protein
LLTGPRKSANPKRRFDEEVIRRHLGEWRELWIVEGQVPDGLAELLVRRLAPLHAAPLHGLEPFGGMHTPPYPFTDVAALADIPDPVVDPTTRWVRSNVLLAAVTSPSTSSPSPRTSTPRNGGVASNTTRMQRGSRLRWVSLTSPSAMTTSNASSLQRNQTGETRTLPSLRYVVNTAAEGSSTNERTRASQSSATCST